MGGSAGGIAGARAPRARPWTTSAPIIMTDAVPAAPVDLGLHSPRAAVLGPLSLPAAAAALAALAAWAAAPASAAAADAAAAVSAAEASAVWAAAPAMAAAADAEDKPTNKKVDVQLAHPLFVLH